MRDTHESIVHHLQQMHATERAQVEELRTLADCCDVPALASLLERHADETRRHGDRLEARLDELSAGGSVRLLLQTYSGSLAKSVVDRLRPDDQLAVLRDAVSAEAGEIISYQLLEQEAIRGGDDSTAVLAAELREEELRTRDELMTFWNQVVDRAIADKVDDGAGSETHVARAMLVDHLQDVHALERNAVIMLSTVLGTVSDPLARAKVDDHREVTVRHGDEISNRLRELQARPSIRKQAQAYAFAAVKGPINLVRAEKAGKDLRDMYVVEWFEQIAYRQLELLADRCGDERTLLIAQNHACDEEAMAEWLERESAHFLLEALGSRAPR